jgi:hypothetical protein
LHSHLIEFTLPATGQQLSVRAGLDEDLQACIDKMGQ